MMTIENKVLELVQKIGVRLKATTITFNVKQEEWSYTLENGNVETYSKESLHNLVRDYISALQNIGV